MTTDPGAFFFFRHHLPVLAALDDADLDRLERLVERERRRRRPACDVPTTVAAYGSSILIGASVGAALVGRLAEWLARAVESGGLL